MKVFAIDPGTKESAYVVFENGVLYTPHEKGGYIVSFPGWSIREKGICGNDVLRYVIKEQNAVDHFVIENMQGGKGRILGKTTIDTIKWIGRFQELIQGGFNKEVSFVFRKTVESHILKTLEKPYPFKSPDSNIRHALVARFGDKTKGLANDEWQAFALAVCFVETVLNINLGDK